MNYCIAAKDPYDTNGWKTVVSVYCKNGVNTLCRLRDIGSATFLAKRVSSKLWTVERADFAPDAQGGGVRVCFGAKTPDVHSVPPAVDGGLTAASVAGGGHPGKFGVPWPSAFRHGWLPLGRGSKTFAVGIATIGVLVHAADHAPFPHDGFVSVFRVAKAAHVDVDPPT